MIAALLAVVALLFVIAAVYVSMTGVGSFTKRRVVVHTLKVSDDRSIRGVLKAAHRDCVILEAPEYLDEANVIPMEGDAVVLRSQIAWMQVL